MRAGLSEAFDILKKWHSEQTALRIFLGFGTLTFRFIGRISKIDEPTLNVVSDDRDSEMSFKVLPPFFFEFMDYRDLPIGAETYEYDLTVFFGPAPNTDHFLAFSELKT